MGVKFRSLYRFSRRRFFLNFKSELRKLDRQFLKKWLYLEIILGSLSKIFFSMKSFIVVWFYFENFILVFSVRFQYRVVYCYCKYRQILKQWFLEFVIIIWLFEVRVRFWGLQSGLVDVLIQDKNDLFLLKICIDIRLEYQGSYICRRICI